MLGLVSDSYTVDSDDENELENVNDNEFQKNESEDVKENNKSKVDKDSPEKSNPKKRGVSIFKVHIPSKLLKEEDVQDEEEKEDETDNKAKSLVELLPQPKKKKIVEEKRIPVLTKPKISIAPELDDINDNETIDNDIKKDDKIEEKESDEEDFVGPQVPSHLLSRNKETTESNVSNSNINQYSEYNVPYNYEINNLPSQYMPKGIEYSEALNGSNWISINARDLHKDKVYLSHDEVLERERATRNALTGASMINRHRGHITFLSSAAKILEKDILLQKERGKKLREETRRKFGW